MRYRGPAPSALLVHQLDAFTAVFHRHSGSTHLLTEPAPQILAVLEGEPLSLDELFARLEGDYDLVDANRAELAARLAELVAAGLVAAV